MSSFFDEASLVMIPSGYKDQKVYSVKPLDGSGDLTFTRASNATRVASDGLIEKVRTNVVLYSQDFSNAAWSKSAGTTLTHSQTDPNGGTTATRVVMTSGTNNFFTQGITGNGVRFNTLSVWVKGVTTGGTLSLNTGTAASRTGTTITYTTDWVRYQIIQNETTSNTGFQIDNFSNSVGQVAGDFLIAFAQVETSDFGATPYIATTSAAVSVGPVSGLPRLDYLNSSCPRLLLEPQRTNSALYSEQFDNAAWNKSNATITANAVSSPDGYTNADSFLPTATTSAHSVDPATLINLLGVVGTFSVFAKYNGYHLSLSIAGTSANWTGCVFDLQNGIARTPQTSGVQAVCTSKIEDYGNGWYRCSITYTPYTSGTFYNYIGAASTNNATLGNFGLQSFAANGTSGAYLYGAQVETSAAYATSYIPTLGTSVTRVADAASKTGISSLIGQTEGTLFVEAKVTLNGRLMLIGAAGNFIEIIINSAGKANGFVRTSVTEADILSAATYATGDTIKVAFAYKQNDFALYVNGTAQGTDTSGNVPTGMAQLIVNDYLSAGFNSANAYSQALLFKTRLTNAQLAELTA